MGKEFLNSTPRYCIWMVHAGPNEMRKFPPLLVRAKEVKDFREKSNRIQTLKAAKYPLLFAEMRQPDSDYLAIPKVSSERRDYIPIAYCGKETICGDKLFFMPNAGLFHFGVLMSEAHMTWVRNVSGRLKGDLRYSKDIVYNNFPWPLEPSKKQIEAIEKAAQKVLDTRAMFPNSSLADMYDPLSMPPPLVKAHAELNKVVDLAYRPQPFSSEANRMVFLFELYEKYTADLFTVQKVKKTKSLQG